MDEQEREIQEVPAEIIEKPQEVIVQQFGAESPEEMLVQAEKLAELAPRLKQAQETILATQTYPADWEFFGDKACLSSAGAERIGRMFPIKFHGVGWKKETATDEHGSYYKYIFEGFATKGEATVFAIGSYGMRDKFLGFANKEWRKESEVNENNIRNAAYHIFCGNAIKALLGLRGIPKAEYDRIMAGTKQNPKNTGKHSYSKGSQGGTDRSDVDKQCELGEICIEFANRPAMVRRGEDGKLYLDDATDEEAQWETIERAKDCCLMVSSFVGKDGKKVSGLPASKLKGKRLDISLTTAKKLKGE